MQIASRSYDDEFLSRGGSGGGHFAYRCRDAVNVFQRVGEPGALAVLQRNRDFAGQLIEYILQPLSRGRLTVKAVNVGRQDHENRRNCAESLHTLHHIAATELLNEFIE